jgi:magnesium chelatase subunit I
MSVANYENIVSNATRRAIRLGERQTAPRVSDLAGVLASTTGKIEIEDLERSRKTRSSTSLSRAPLPRYSTATFRFVTSIGSF